MFWNLLITLIVIVATIASAALPVATLKQWSGGWRVASSLSLMLLAVWLILIVASRLLDSASHQLWSLELFAWAMLNMIYMVALMTIKKILERADKEASLTD